MTQPRRISWADPHVFGTLCGLFSAFGYTVTNSCLRAAIHSDPIWVSAVKALPTALLIAPWMIVQAHRGERLFPDRFAAAAVIFAGLFGQLVGNVGFQFALGEIGIGLSVPLTLGGMIISAAILARCLLLEPITPRGALALAILLSAVVILSIGAGKVHPPLADASAGGAVSPWRAAAGAAAAVLSGFAYAVLNVSIRFATMRGASLTFTLVAVSTVGILALGSISYFRIGIPAMLETPLHDWAAILMAGIWNAASFLALIAALRMTSVVFVNGVNATQSAMAAVAGTLLFGEPVTGALVAGVVLTAVGLFIMSTAKRRPESAAISSSTRPPSQACDPSVDTPPPNPE